MEDRPAGALIDIALAKVQYAHDARASLVRQARHSVTASSHPSTATHSLPARLGPEVARLDLQV